MYVIALIKNNCATLNVLLTGLSPYFCVKNITYTWSYKFKQFANLCAMNSIIYDLRLQHFVEGSWTIPDYMRHLLTLTIYVWSIQHPLPTWQNKSLYLIALKQQKIIHTVTWHIRVLSLVIRRPIRSVYPKYKQYTRPLLNRLVLPRVEMCICPHDEPLIVM